jgi:tryptophan synthase beta subunit
VTVLESPATTGLAGADATPKDDANGTGRRRPASKRNVVAEIAERRRVDVREEMARLTLDDHLAIAAGTRSPRPILDRLAAPGLHVIAEIKRSSPSAGTIASRDEDIVARARAYEAGGAAAISVLCEPHWFGGSVDDLRAVRAAVSIPVLAKEFVVEPIQLPHLRAAGADLVLLLAVLHPAKRLARLVERALEIGLEPLVEAHDERELDRALATGARLIGLNNRDLRTLDVDTERAVRLRELVPDDRLVIAESGARDAATVAGWRAVGFDAALVGEALVRAPDPAAAVRTFVAAGRPPSDPANLAATPFVKICGITDAEGVLAAVRTGADAIGLNLVPGTPRALSLAEAVELRRVARALAPVAGGGPRIVAITADAGPDRIAEIVAALDPDAVQLSGVESPDEVALESNRRETWKVLHLPAAEPPDPRAAAATVASIVALGREHLAAGASRLLLDTAGGPHPGGTGTRAAPSLAAAVARELPVVLAGGLSPANVASAVRATPAVGVDVASGVERPRTPGERPTKDPLAVAIFVKRSRGARLDRPNLAVRPTPVDPGLLAADDAGRWGVDREFGGRYVPETLMAALRQLEDAYAALRHDSRFWADLRELLARYAGRPTALYRAERLAYESLERAIALDGRARLPHRLRIHLKREDLAHTGAHKINNALGQALLTRRLGKTRVIAETGAGQHGVATATACALLGLPCVVFMGAEDIERQQPNVLRMKALGTEVRPVTSGTATLKDAVNEAMRDWVTNVETTHYVLGSAMGPHPYPTIVRDLQRRIGDEAAAQVVEVEGRLPDLAFACVGGGSNAIGLLDRFIGEPSVRIAVAEAAGEGLATGRHAAALAGGTPGILHGSRSLMLQDRDGQVTEAHSISAGLDYPGVGPQISALYAAGRLEVTAATDGEALAAMRWVARAEGILPALETAHAFATLPRLLAGMEGAGGDWPEETVVLIGLSGRGDKDLATLGKAEATEGTAGTRATDG